MDTQLLNDLIKNRRSVFPDQFVPGKKLEGIIIEQILVNLTLGIQSWHNGALAFYTVYRRGLQSFATFQSNLYKQYSGSVFKHRHFCYSYFGC